MPTVEPFRAGVPTTASLVFAIMDSEGRVVRDDSTVVTLSLQGQNIAGESEGMFTLSDSCQILGGSQCFAVVIGCQLGPIPMRASSGVVEFTGLRLSGKSTTQAVLTCSAATLNSTVLTVSLIGGKVRWFQFERMKNGLLTVPGKFFGDLFGTVKDIIGTSPFIEIGKSVIIGTDSTDYRYITIRAVDWWNNTATIPTTVGIFASGGTPPIDQQRSPLLGQMANTDPKTGIAEFKDFQILGVTASNISLHFYSTQMNGEEYIESVRGSRPWATRTVSLKNSASLTCSPGNPGALGINVVPNSAVGLAPIGTSELIPGWAGYQTARRFPSSFEIGKSNASDTSRWFYLQAIDKFGNRVDNGPNAYNGGTATIHFATPEEGLPRSTTSRFQFSASNDPFVRVNSQRFVATGTSAVAVNGLYTFNNFMPLAPASMGATDMVVMTFEDTALKGVNSPFPLVPWLFRPIPPITTATTTFVRTTDVRLHEEASGLYATPNPASDALHIALALPESAPVLMRVEDMLGRTLLRHEEQSAMQGAFTTTLDVSRLPQGVYTLHVQSGRERWTRRVIVLR